MLERHLRFAAHGAAQLAGQLKLVESAAGADEGRAQLGQFLFLVVGEAVGRFADQLAETLALFLHLGIDHFVAGDHRAGVDLDAFDVARLEPLAAEVTDELGRVGLECGAGSALAAAGNCARRNAIRGSAALRKRGVRRNGG